MGNSVFGLIGLGVMGKSLSLNIAEKGHSLSVYNRSESGEEHVVSSFLEDNPSFNTISGYTDLSTFVQSLERPRKIMVMIKAGPAIDEVIEALLPLLSEGDIIIDGGNSHYEDTNRRCESLNQKGLHFIGCGISGGEAGARHGPSIMPGGSKDAYAMVAPVLESIAARDTQQQPCCTLIGPDGAGHFIKMVHNGIEYVEMQLLAELYAILSKQMDYEAIADIFSIWNTGSLSGYLLEITVNILGKKEGDRYVLDLILDTAGNKGTGSWSSISAFNLGYPNTMMSAAVFARYISAFKDGRTQLSQYANKNDDAKIDLKALENAYRFARIINHQQGFALMRQASLAYHWELNLSEIARIWINGCIIKSDFMTGLIEVFKSHNDLLDHRPTLDTLKSHEADLSEILQQGISKRIALEAFGTAYNYWVAMTTKTLPANLIQAQRDYFGAHTYQRIDAPSSQFFHTNWSET